MISSHESLHIVYIQKVCNMIDAMYSHSTEASSPSRICLAGLLINLAKLDKEVRDEFGKSFH